jgi:hypothetical protein
MSIRLEGALRVFPRGCCEFGPSKATLAAMNESVTYMSNGGNPEKEETSELAAPLSGQLDDETPLYQLRCKIYEDWLGRAPFFSSAKESAAATMHCRDPAHVCVVPQPPSLADPACSLFIGSKSVVVTQWGTNVVIASIPFRALVEVTLRASAIVSVEDLDGKGGTAAAVVGSASALGKNGRGFAAGSGLSDKPELLLFVDESMMRHNRQYYKHPDPSERLPIFMDGTNKDDAEAPPPPDPSDILVYAFQPSDSAALYSAELALLHQWNLFEAERATSNVMALANAAMGTAVSSSSDSHDPNGEAPRTTITLPIFAPKRSEVQSSIAQPKRMSEFVPTSIGAEHPPVFRQRAKLHPAPEREEDRPSKQVQHGVARAGSVETVNNTRQVTILDPFPAAQGMPVGNHPASSSAGYSVAAPAPRAMPTPLDHPSGLVHSPEAQPTGYRLSQGGRSDPLSLYHAEGTQTVAQSRFSGQHNRSRSDSAKSARDSATTAPTASSNEIHFRCIVCNMQVPQSQRSAHEDQCAAPKRLRISVPRAGSS